MSLHEAMMEHVIHCQLEKEITVEDLCQLSKEHLADAVIELRRDWLRERQSRKVETRVAELERELAWSKLRYHQLASFVSPSERHAAASRWPPAPPEGWKHD